MLYPPLFEQRIRSLFLSPLASSRCSALRLQLRRNQSSRSMPQAVGRPGDLSGRCSSVFWCQQFLTAFPAVHGLERFAGTHQTLTHGRFLQAKHSCDLLGGETGDDRQQERDAIRGFEMTQAVLHQIAFGDQCARIVLTWDLLV